MYSYDSYEVARMVDGPYDGECTAVEPGSKKTPVTMVNPNVFREPDPKTIVKQTLGWYQNTNVKDTEGRVVFVWQGWED